MKSFLVPLVSISNMSATSRKSTENKPGRLSSLSRKSSSTSCYRRLLSVTVATTTPSSPGGLRFAGHALNNGLWCCCVPKVPSGLGMASSGACQALVAAVATFDISRQASHSFRQDPQAGSAEMTKSNIVTGRTGGKGHSGTHDRSFVYSPGSTARVDARS